MQLFWRVKPRDATFWGCADFENSYAYLCPCPLLDLGRLIRLDQEGQAGGATVAEKRFGFAYNAAGLFTSLARYKDTDGGLQGQLFTLYGESKAGHPFLR